MSAVSIPPWTMAGLLPPINTANPAGPDRSPYFVSLSEVVLRYGTSDDRRRILDGFLRYRARLHVAGLTLGFQWLDGSFLEDIELIEGRSPRDLDVVTFFRLPPGISQAEARARAPDAFPLTSPERIAMKSVFHVDAYLVDLNGLAERLVRTSAYWYSMWSHRRDERWKGYLQVDLSPAEDGTASGHLTALPAPGGTP